MTCRFCYRECPKHTPEKICPDCRARGMTKADFKLKRRHVDFVQPSDGRRAFYQVSKTAGMFAVKLKKRFIFKVEKGVLYRGKLMRLSWWQSQ